VLAKLTFGLVQLPWFGWFVGHRIPAQAQRAVRVT
jgi:hypothetical protein